MIELTKEQRQELRRKWVEALRSGEFLQTDCALHDDHGYCCLGVACEVFEREFPGELNVTLDDNGYWHYDGEDTFLPEKVADAFGIHPEGRTKNSRLLETPTQSSNSLYENSLYDLNDSGVTFTEIADVIEKYAADLFTDDSQAEAAKAEA